MSEQKLKPNRSGGLSVHQSAMASSTVGQTHDNTISLRYQMVQSIHENVTIPAVLVTAAKTVIETLQSDQEIAVR